MSTLSPPPRPTPPSASPQPPNPISLRLYKVLAASFDDDATREAIRTLSDLYIAPPAKGKEVRRDDDADLDDADELDVPARAQAKPGGRGIDEAAATAVVARARKNLRRDVDTMLAASSRKFLAAFGEVDKQLDILQEHIGTMRERCDEAQTQLRQTSDACRTLLDRAGSLREERHEVAMRQNIVSLFLARFTLSEDEKEAITSRDVPVGKRFFAAMDRAEKIRDDCRVLLSGADVQPTAGLEITLATSALLEQAYDKLFRWCCAEFRLMARDTQLDASPALREAVRRLQQRPELLTEALAHLAQTRESALLAAFTGALTRGGVGGLPRPIELHAHDPLRYAGDMLAWVHQALAAEREGLEGLFGVAGRRRMVGAVRTREGPEEAWMSEMLDRAVGGLGAPLKVRVMQTVRSQESSITSYKLANLLQFYMLTMQRTIGEDAVLSRTLQELTDASYKAFFDAIDALGRALLRAPLDLDDHSVSPPLAILDHAQVLREIMAVYESSLLGDESAEEQTAGFRAILDRLVDPALEMVPAAAEAKQRQRPRWDGTVFVLNTLEYLLGVLEPFAWTQEKQEVVKGRIAGVVAQLTEEHYNTILRDAGLDEVAAALESRQPDEPLSRVPAAQAGRLQQALDAFSGWLSGAGVVHAERLAAVDARRVAGDVHSAALGRVAETYGRLCEEVRRAENRYEAGATLLGGSRPFGQVHLLWQIFGLEGGAAA
ncbi:oligomeric complex COG6 [Obba rivulosa]|uniref:Conserved oligomeric Golgi complex subunit 6 n=1 Tax=Obba rivulosa TaxID=1052685 RepID=A0A8E2DQG4_9APHY|nr:oligomeric complex COG6 [Obba rivulosa]